MTGCVCFPSHNDEGDTYWVWAAQGFATCAYSPLEKAAFIMGMISLLMYFIVMAPQIYETYKTKKVENISLGLWVQWLLGDIFNLAACILTQAYPSQLFVAIYFCLNDGLMVTQYLYYKIIYPKRQARKNVATTVVVSGIAALTFYSRVASRFGPATGNMMISPGRLLMQTSNAPNDEYICDYQPLLTNEVKILGYVLAWICAGLYFCSRIPQIYKNFKLKSVEGLSPGLFALALIGNIAYGLGIILNTPPIDEKFYGSMLPFLIGSMGTIVFDILVLTQIAMYRRPKAPKGYVELD